MPDHNTDNATGPWLRFDRQHYDALLDRLVAEVKEKYPDYPAANEPALRLYFAKACAKGVNISLLNFDKLAQMQPEQLVEAAEKLSDKLTPESRKLFEEAARRRTNAARWENLFPDGNNELFLPLSALNAKSIDADIEACLAKHNIKADAFFKVTKSTEDKQVESGALDSQRRTAGKDISQRHVRRDPNDPAKLQTLNPNPKPGKDPWEPGQKLGAFLEARNEWSILDDFQVENSRKGDAEIGQASTQADIRELMLGNRSNAADTYDPKSLMVVISRDPQKIGEMSSGQHWKSCMAEDGINFRYVPMDIEAGSLVAYVVSKNDPEARYPLMRQLLKPYSNAQGETILVPAKTYGDDVSGNSFTRQSLVETLSSFVRNNVNNAAAGTFEMDSRLYSDGQATTINLQSNWSKETLEQGLQKFHDGAMQEWMTERNGKNDAIAKLNDRMEK